MKEIDLYNKQFRYVALYKENNYSSPLIGSTLLISAIILFVVYWLFFGIWCVINAYHSNKLSLAWVILLFILNIVAYMIFALDKTSNLKIKTS